MRPWLGLVIGLALTGATAGMMLATTRKRKPLGAVVREREHAPKVIEDEIDEAATRAEHAGAKGELEFIGVGMTGIVFCDQAGRAFKVSRKHRKEGAQSTAIKEEAAWFQQAAQVPGVKEHVPRDVSYDDRNHVLVRECVRAAPGRDRRRNEKKLFELHQRIRSAMGVYGWSAPEFKPDSYVYTRRGPILVDGGFANRQGHALVRDVLDVLNDRRALAKHERLSSLAFDLRIERGRTIPVDIANRLLKRMQAIDPSVEL
jgi:hypothetical protein